MSISLLVGFGNPGAQYEKTRHNAGFWLLDKIADQHRIHFRLESKFHGEICRLNLNGQECWLLKPTTFMNLSGQAVNALAQFYKISPAQILIAHDELDLEVGIVRLKRGGGHGGHNGLRDTVKHLGTSDFARIRIGIGHPGQREQVVNHVLNQPSATERNAIDDSLTRITDLLPQILTSGFDKAMQQLNTKN